GLVAGVAGGALLVSAGLHDEWRLLARIEAGRVGDDASPVARPDGRRGLGGWARAEWDRALGWGLCGGAAVLLAATYPPVAASGLAMRRSVSAGLLSLERRSESVVETAAVVAPAEVDGLWTADGLRRFHRSACPALPPAAVAQRRPVPRSTDLEPCRICRAGE